ncbi:glycoside hydrolase family 3 N-terminal domain-containing protein [Thioclava sp. F36-6]|uniref:glycoside hydrolase family 3 N-terminal domain-containing protein n=1 Tax=Thioclava sp. F36-6 TaxID=1915316 RepID=UPI000995F413|nr:glycoside hydrolase family 3 N-terminal domain-containing protein [Thioclava sp. F36-6]OOY30958.1 beta-hexosaminidase [Thioclava sp. F36-6]
MGVAAIFGCEGTELSARERDFFREADPWGFILFSRNIDTPEQVARLTDALRGAVGRDAPVLIDQEGGRVQRMRGPQWREWLPPLEQAKRAGDAAPRSFWLRSRIMAEELRAVGIDVNCAPTCDIAGLLTHPFLQNRCLGKDAATVIANARATAEGLLAGGVLPVIKHIPGHGRAISDSHKDLPVVEASKADLIATDFAPFKALADLPLGMTAHIRFTALDDAPATQSAKIIKMIREEIGFGGLLMSDDIGMEALAGGFGTRTAAALAAGCDLVLHCKGDMPAMEEVAMAAPAMSEAAKARAEAALDRRLPPETVDMAALDAELEALLSGGMDE